MRALLFLCLLIAAPLLHAQDSTRGIQLLVRDAASERTVEVPLYGKSHAVIIGIDRYQHLPPDRQLQYAVRDAQGIEAVLRKHYKFDRIDTLYNHEATRSRILDLLTDELPARMGENDALFVFFAGHGDQIKRPDGDVGYLIPHDGRVGKLASVISMADLRDTISKAVPAKHVFYVVDACYGGLLTSTRAVDKAPRRDLAYLQEITRERVRQVLTAGDKGQEVLDGGRNGHSVFTGRLIEVLEQAGDFITANEIQAIIKERVHGDARARSHTQTPAYGTLYGNGDFVFIPSIERKAIDNRQEIARLEAELQAIAEAESRAQATAGRAERERRQREADAARRAAEGRLKAERLKQQQLADAEAQRRADEAQRQSLLAARGEDEKKLAELKAAAQAKRKTANLSSADRFATADAAAAEIKRLDAEINRIEAGYASELAQTRRQIEQRHAARRATLDQETRDEFESPATFQARQQQQRSQLDRQRDEELARLDAKALAEAETAPLRAEIQALAGREYTLGAERIELQLGTYDAEQSSFPILLRDKAPGKGKPLQLASGGSLALAPDAARTYKQQWKAGLIHPEIRLLADGQVTRIALTNAADGSEWVHFAGRYSAVRHMAIIPEMVVIPGKDYAMGKYEVTQAQYQACVDDSGCKPPEWLEAGSQYHIYTGSDGYYKTHLGSDRPAIGVSWDNAQSYVQWLSQKTGKSYRLPTEAEWKHACDGGVSREYCGGDNLGALGWYSDNSGRQTHPVGQKRPNGYGLYDMSGNVREWQQDCYDGDCSGRVLRGGSWLNYSEDARAANRSWDTPSGRGSLFGFRVARSARTN